ncbi:hypothetical protein SLEP1_g5865 [Rubroshorea leprosula]|uniref:Uncharacterized protein n=1 Tax=Rubroshorea leprosula TaxID=152421 RepID=A0AAV5I363_9ROSI|nr:hypothetical protein SLEP1_g5865 [Rubroshorea leprosula]
MDKTRQNDKRLRSAAVQNPDSHNGQLIIWKLQRQVFGKSTVSSSGSPAAPATVSPCNRINPRDCLPSPAEAPRVMLMETHCSIQNCKTRGLNSEEKDTIEMGFE